jgi:hypothetical protein
MSADGRRVSQAEIQLFSGQNLMNISVPSGLPTGQYFLHVQGAGFTDTKSVLVGE